MQIVWYQRDGRRTGPTGTTCCRALVCSYMVAGSPYCTSTSGWTLPVSLDNTYDTKIRNHHHRVACPSVSIAISTNWRHFERSCAVIHAVLRPRLWGRRSSSIVRSHVHLGRPARRRQSARGRLMAARRMGEWSCDGSALARCPNRRSRLFAITEVTGGLTCSTPHFFVGDMRRIWNMYYTVKTPLVKCIETSTGGHSHTPRVSSVKKYREYVHIVKSNLGLQTDGRSTDVTV